LIPFKFTIEINESVEFLQNDYSKAKVIRRDDRIKTLIYVKYKKHHFQSDIGKNWRELRKPFGIG
jgi:hypothetical protein